MHLVKELGKAWIVYRFSVYFARKQGKYHTPNRLGVCLTPFERTFMACADPDDGDRGLEPRHHRGHQRNAIDMVFNGPVRILVRNPLPLSKI